MRGNGFAVILFFLGILLIAVIIIITAIYIKNSHPEWLSKKEISNKKDTATSMLSESTPCIKINHPSDFQLSKDSRIITTKTVKEGASEYGSSLLIIDKKTPGEEAYGIIIYCAPSSWSIAQRGIATSNLNTLNTTLNSVVNSGKDPIDQRPAKYDLALSQVGNLQNINNLSATKITEVYYTEDDSLWNVNETIYVTLNNYFYQFHNGGSARDKSSIINEIKQFESLFSSAVLFNPLSH